MTNESTDVRKKLAKKNPVFLAQEYLQLQTQQRVK